MTAVGHPPAVRLPAGQPGRYVALALLASTAGILGLVPHMPGALSALLVAFFVGVGPGCAALAWVGPPAISRLVVVPALGLTAVIVVTGTAATIGWWAPRGLFAMIALLTVWSTAFHLPALVRDMTR